MDSANETSAVAFTGASIAEADLVKGLLVANGIPAVIRDESAVVMLDGMITGSKGVAVLVPASVLDEARVVLEEARAAGDVEFSDEESDV